MAIGARGRSIYGRRRESDFVWKGRSGIEPIYTGSTKATPKTVSELKCPGTSLCLTNSSDMLWRTCPLSTKGCIIFSSSVLEWQLWIWSRRMSSD
jgi:hypothetical protein